MIKKILKIYKKNKEIINYLIVGGLTTVISLGSYSLFRFIKIDYITATVLAWVTAVIFAYFANKYFVFEKKTVDNLIFEFLNFVKFRLFTLFVDLVIMYLMVDLLHINDFIAKLVVQVVVTILNYIFSKIFVFKK